MKNPQNTFKTLTEHKKHSEYAQLHQ